MKPLPTTNRGTLEPARNFFWWIREHRPDGSTRYQLLLRLAPHRLDVLAQVRTFSAHELDWLDACIDQRQYIARELRRRRRDLHEDAKRLNRATHWPHEGAEDLPI